MKILLLILLCPTFIFSQRVPVNLSNYDNYVTIDDYYGETNSLLLKYKIKTARCFLETDSNQLIGRKYYKDGKLFRSETIDIKTGKPIRIIFYSNPEKNILEGELIHYPSSDNYNILPSRNYDYLWTYSSNSKSKNLRYQKDSSGVVYMKIRYQWLSNGDIFFRSYDKNGAKVDSLLMKRLINPRELSNKQERPQDYILYHIDSSINKIVKYNNNGNETYWKECYDKKQCTEYKYTYDERGLLIRKEHYINGKSYYIFKYAYE